MAFGGKAWNISTADMNLGTERSGSTRCVGGIFDLTLGSDIPPGGGNPSWVVGDTFLVSALYLLQVQKAEARLIEKRVFGLPCRLTRVDRVCPALRSCRRVRCDFLS